MERYVTVTKELIKAMNEASPKTIVILALIVLLVFAIKL